MQFGVSRAWIVGECTECGEPSTGEYDSNKYGLSLICVSCGIEDQYEVDEDGENFIELGI